LEQQLAAASAGMSLMPVLDQYQQLGGDAEARMERDQQHTMLNQLITSARKVSQALLKIPDPPSSDVDAALWKQVTEHDFIPVLTKQGRDEVFVDSVSLLFAKAQEQVQEHCTNLDNLCDQFHLPETSWKKGIEDCASVETLLEVAQKTIVNISGDAVNSACGELQKVHWLVHFVFFCLL